MKDDIPAKAAILQRDQETYAIMAPLLGGVMDLPTARRIAEVCESFQVSTLKITGAQRLALIGLREEDIDRVYGALGTSPKRNTELCRQYIKVCPGDTYCTRGQRDTISFARKLEEAFYPLPKITAKVKIGVAGCYNSCMEPAIKDIGLIGLKSGWIVMVGGAGGKEPILGEVIAKNKSDDEVIELVDRILKYYRAASMRHQTRNLRLGVILQKQGGKEALRRVCGAD